MRRKVINPSLEHTYKKSLHVDMKDSDRIVIFSDFHMGNGKKKDDFLHNAEMVETILRDYYFKKNYNLILNGDIEELQKFSLSAIEKRWQPLYDIFDLFHMKQRLYKIAGNHDDKLLLEIGSQKYPLYDGLRLFWRDQEFFIYHGHQSSKFYTNFNKLIEFALHYIVLPLGIKNLSDKDNNRKKHSLEHNSYIFSRYKKIVSLIGHTHRPLFESRSIKENIIYKIEYLLRNYRKADEEEQKNIRYKITKLKKRLEDLPNENLNNVFASIYSNDLIIPCLFNSGCAIGKRGITCLELEKGKINLTYWFDRRNEQKRIKIVKNSVPVKGTYYNRHVLKSEDLSYISDCIEFFN